MSMALSPLALASDSVSLPITVTVLPFVQVHVEKGLNFGDLGQAENRSESTLLCFNHNYPETVRTHPENSHIDHQSSVCSGVGSVCSIGVAGASNLAYSLSIQGSPLKTEDGACAPGGAFAGQDKCFANIAMLLERTANNHPTQGCNGETSLDDYNYKFTVNVDGDDVKTNVDGQYSGTFTLSIAVGVD